MLAAAVSTGAFAQGPEKKDAPGKVGIGKELYDSKCLFCHGAKGDGNGPASASLSPKPAALNDVQFQQKYSDQQIADTILKGKGMMPAFALSQDEIAAVVKYVRELKNDHKD